MAFFVLSCGWESLTLLAFMCGVLQGREHALTLRPTVLPVTARCLSSLPGFKFK